jgi:two-component system KDP operon response regulator KdpE
MRDGILVIDEPAARQELCALLHDRGFQVHAASSKAAARQLVGSLGLRAIFLELDLIDGDGLELIDELRCYTNIPLLVVCRRAGERDHVEAFDRGANDYIVKPFRPELLLARLRAALRASPFRTYPRGLQVGALRLQPFERRVYLEDKEVPLTPTEFSLLHVMAQRPGHVLTHRELLHDVWGPTKTNDQNYLRVCMCHLRRKLEKNPERPRMLLTSPGVGYQLKAPS